MEGHEHPLQFPWLGPKTHSNTRPPSSSSDVPRGRLVPLRSDHKSGEKRAADPEILCANSQPGNWNSGRELASSLCSIAAANSFSPRLHFPPSSPNPPIRRSRVLARHGYEGCKWLNLMWKHWRLTVLCHSRRLKGGIRTVQKPWAILDYPGLVSGIRALKGAQADRRLCMGLFALH